MFVRFAEIVCRDSLSVAVGSLSIKSLLFAGVPLEIGFVRKGESVSLCLSIIIAVCEEMLVASAVTAWLWEVHTVVYEKVCD